MTDYEPVPLDFVVLDKLPDVGLVGGIHWRGRQVKDLVVEVNEGLAEQSAAAPKVQSSEVQARVRELKKAGLVKDFKGGSGGSRIWARTPAGTEFLSKREEYLSYE